MVVPGCEVGQIHMLGGVDVFGSPTSLKYRADLVRKEERFYPNSSAEADTSACCKSLRETDYGFVHQVLSYERVHDSSMTTRSQSLNAYLPFDISDLLEYGDGFLSADETRRRLQELMTQYYDFLTIGALKRRDNEFWAYHRQRLTALGTPLRRLHLGKAVCATLLGLLFNPKHTLETLSRLRQRA